MCSPTIRLSYVIRAQRGIRSAGRRVARHERAEVQRALVGRVRGVVRCVGERRRRLVGLAAAQRLADLERRLVGGTADDRRQRSAGDHPRVLGGGRVGEPFDVDRTHAERVRADLELLELGLVEAVVEDHLGRLLLAARLPAERVDLALERGVRLVRGEREQGVEQRRLRRRLEQDGGVRGLTGRRAGVGPGDADRGRVGELVDVDGADLDGVLAGAEVGVDRRVLAVLPLQRVGGVDAALERDVDQRRRVVLGRVVEGRRVAVD